MKHHALKAVIWTLMFITLACGRSYQENGIRQLQERFREADDSEQRRELANRLQRSYSLFHLTYEDTMFLRDWGELAFRGREYEQARDVFTELAQDVGDDPSVFLRLSEINKRLGFIAEAATNDSVASELMQNEAAKKRYLKRSRYYREVYQQISSAESKMRRGVPGDQPRLMRARAYMSVQLDDAALYDIQKVIDKDSTIGYSYYLMGKLLYDNEQYQLASTAIATYQKNAVRVDSTLHMVNELSDLIARQEQLNEFEKRLEENRVTYAELIEAGSMAFQLDRNSMADKIFNRIVRAYPDSTRGYLYRGQLSIKTGRLDQAEKDLKKAVMMNPENIAAHNLLGYLYLLKKDFEGMREEVNIIRSLDGKPLDVLIGEEPE